MKELTSIKSSALVCFLFRFARVLQPVKLSNDGHTWTSNVIYFHSIPSLLVSLLALFDLEDHTLLDYCLLSDSERVELTLETCSRSWIQIRHGWFLAFGCYWNCFKMRTCFTLLFAKFSFVCTFSRDLFGSPKPCSWKVQPLATLFTFNILFAIFCFHNSILIRINKWFN